MQAQMVASIWSNVQQHPQHDNGEKTVSAEGMRTGKAWHGKYKCFFNLALGHPYTD